MKNWMLSYMFDVLLWCNYSNSLMEKHGGKSVSFPTWSWILALNSCMALRKLFSFSESQFPLVKAGLKYLFCDIFMRIK